MTRKPDYSKPCPHSCPVCGERMQWLPDVGYGPGGPICPNDCDVWEHFDRLSRGEQEEALLDGAGDLDLMDWEDDQ